MFNKRLSVESPDSPLKGSITYLDEIELDANQNSFSLQVAALSYQAPEMNRLEYKLEGFDREWYAVGRNSIINYSNLPYGTYVLHIKGSNSDGKWNAVEKILNIRIRPPFYLSPWAYAVYIILTLCSLLSLIVFFRKRTRQKHVQTMERFEREKERELYTAKIDFFTNVAHEIRTPLTLIKSPLENVLTSGSISEDIKDDLEIMDLNTNRLLDLVNQLLDFRRGPLACFALMDGLGNLHGSIDLFHDAATQHLFGAPAQKLHIAQRRLHFCRQTLMLLGGQCLRNTCQRCLLTTLIAPRIESGQCQGHH